MPSFERLQEAYLPADGTIMVGTNSCMRTVMKQKGIASSSSLQNQIDLFLNHYSKDQTSPLPGIKI